MSRPPHTTSLLSSFGPKGPGYARLVRREVMGGVNVAWKGNRETQWSEQNVESE